MATEVEICNRALSRIGVDDLIEDLLDPSPQANACRQHYEPCRDELLQDFPWNFAQKVVALAPVTGVTIPGYEHVYRYPTDCLRAQVVTDKGGTRLPYEVNRFDIWDYQRIDRRMPFRIMADPNTAGARILVTDMPEAYLWLTGRVTDPNQMTGLFRSALAWKLAAELALALRTNTALYQNAAREMQLTVSIAQCGSLNEERPDPEASSPTVQARW